MALTHKCSNCGQVFRIDRATLLKTGWGRSLSAGFRSVTEQVDDYRKVKCPKCGTVEKDERILSYGFLKPRAVIWAVLVVIAVLLVFDALT